MNQHLSEQIKMGIMAELQELYWKRTRLERRLSKMREAKESCLSRIEMTKQRIEENQGALKILSTGHPFRQRIATDLYQCCLRLQRLGKRRDAYSHPKELKLEAQLKACLLQINFYEQKLNRIISPEGEAGNSHVRPSSERKVIYLFQEEDFNADNALDLENRFLEMDFELLAEEELQRYG